ncbi:hypothetical protein Bca4012_072236 [Brassica carinata]|uniref:Uncharacterized protein n=1 Tax=Brassica carinata TaxID=52824 RepID=A0A8X7QH57_BRACI|nr:hypothetical protein Bca52824_064637 [Brassica carinata]
MANSSIFFSDFKSGRCSSTVQVRFLQIAPVLGAINVRCGGELMGVDMLLLDSEATMMVATMNVNRLATYMPNAFKALM